MGVGQGTEIKRTGRGGEEADDEDGGRGGEEEFSMKK